MLRGRYGEPVSHVVLLGDSHLARITAGRLDAIASAVGAPVINVAVGGATSRDLRKQVCTVADDIAAVVVSVGANDAAPWMAVPLADFDRHLTELLDRVSCAAILLTPPPVDEHRLESRTDNRTNAVLSTYAAAITRLTAQRGIPVLDTAAVLSGVEADWHEPDGLHINAVGYGVLVPAIATAVGAAMAARVAVLRQWTVGDGPWYVAQLGDSELQRFTTETVGTSASDFSEVLATMSGSPDQFGWAIVDPSAVGALAGNLALARVDDAVHLHYWIAPDSRGHGLARRAVEQALSWARSHWPDEALDARLSIRVGNVSSVHVAEATGFERDPSRDLVVDVRAERWSMLGYVRPLQP